MSKMKAHAMQFTVQTKEVSNEAATLICEITGEGTIIKKVNKN